MPSFCVSLEPPLEYGIRETTAPGYSGSFRTLNVERLPFNPLRGLTVVERSAVLNGILQGSPLNALRKCSLIP